MCNVRYHAHHESSVNGAGWTSLSMRSMGEKVRRVSTHIFSRILRMLGSDDRTGCSQPALSKRSTPSLTDQLKGLSCHYPNENSAGVLCIESRDLESIQDRSYVNDTIMDYEIKRLETSQNPATKRRTLFCNSFFYKKLLEELHRVGDTEDAVCTSSVNLPVTNIREPQPDQGTYAAFHSQFVCFQGERHDKWRFE